MEAAGARTRAAARRRGRRLRAPATLKEQRDPQPGGRLLQRRWVRDRWTNPAAPSRGRAVGPESMGARPRPREARWELRAQDSSLRPPSPLSAAGPARRPSPHSSRHGQSLGTGIRPQQRARLGILAPWREALTSSSAKCVDRASHPWRWICAEDPSVAFLIAQGRPACVIRIIRAHAGQERGWCLERGHLNWSLRRWRISVGGEWTEGCSSLREQNGQRHVSIVCIKKCKPEAISPCVSKCGLVCWLQSALFLYPFI